MPFLTQKNAPSFLGKDLDTAHRLLHHYPLTVRQWDSGRYYVQDRSGTCWTVPEEVDSFDRIWFDIVDGCPLPPDPVDNLRRVNKTRIEETSAPGKFVVAAREESNGRWWYLKNYYKGLYTFTRDRTYAKPYCRSVALRHQSHLHPDILNQ